MFTSITPDVQPDTGQDMLELQIDCSGKAFN
jgi:hypothetical protein